MAVFDVLYKQVGAFLAVAVAVAVAAAGVADFIVVAAIGAVLVVPYVVAAAIGIVSDFAATTIYCIINNLIGSSCIMVQFFSEMWMTSWSLAANWRLFWLFIRPLNLLRLTYCMWLTRVGSTRAGMYFSIYVKY